MRALFIKREEFHRKREKFYKHDTRQHSYQICSFGNLR